MSVVSAERRPLRIVQVATSYAPFVGGAEKMLQAVSERLVERGHDVTVLTFDCATLRDFSASRGAGLPPEEVLNGVRVIRLNPSPPLLLRLHQSWLRLPGGWRTSTWLMGTDLVPLRLPGGARVVTRLPRLPADVVTCSNWYFGLAFWACLPRPLRRVPRVAIPLLHIEREWANSPMYPRLLSQYDGTIVLTDAERDFVLARGARSVSVAGGGVDPSRYAARDGGAIRARHGLGDRPIVGFVGRQVEAKGVPTLIDAMRRVWQSFPEAMLLLAGQSAHRAPIVTDMLSWLSERDRARVVLIDDFADADTASIFDACDVLALPSVEESFGLVMIEAWMCGKPVIGADIASTRCIIEPGVDGWTARPFDSAHLAERIVDLLANPAKRREFGARGREKALSQYTWDAVTNVWEGALNAAVTPHRRPLVTAVAPALSPNQE